MEKWMARILFTIVMSAEMGLSLSAQAHPVCNTSKVERSTKKIRFVSDHPENPMSPVGLDVSRHKSFIRFRIFLDKKFLPAIFVRTGKGYLSIPYQVCGKTVLLDRKIDNGGIVLWFHHSPIEITPSLDESTRKASERTPKE